MNTSEIIVWVSGVPYSVLSFIELVKEINPNCAIDNHYYAVDRLQEALQKVENSIETEEGFPIILKFQRDRKTIALFACHKLLGPLHVEEQKKVGRMRIDSELTALESKDVDFMEEVIIQVDDCFHPVDQFLSILRTEIGTLLYKEYFEYAYTDVNKLLDDLKVFEEEAKQGENNGIVLSVHGVKNLVCRITFFHLLPSKAKSKLPRSGFIMGAASATHMDTTLVNSPEHTGGSVNYYKVRVDQPIDETQASYVAECLDVSIALNLTPEEFNIFKAIWRTAAERTLGLAKEGNNAKYDAEKIKFFADVNLRRYL